MKKCALAAIFTLMTLFSACGENAVQAAEKTASFYSGLTSCGLTARVTMDHGTYITEYVLFHSYSENVHTITVIEPLGLSGLTMTFDGETTELRFKDAVFLPPSLEGTKATPAKLLPDMLNSLISGNYEAVCMTERNGESCVSLGMWSNVDGDEIMYRTSVSAESFAPVSFEAFCDGRSVLTAEYTEVRFGES